MVEIFSHHATAIVGNSDEIVPILLRELEVLGVVKNGNPDFFHEKFEVMSIDESRRVLEIHKTRPFLANKPRVFIIEINGATREAQNALLKTLEEPQPGNFFFIILPLADILLPTVRSRMRVIGAHEIFSKSVANLSSVNEAAGFLRMSLSEKIAYVDDLAAKISDEKLTKQHAIVFLNQLEKELRDAFLGDASKVSLGNFEAIARARDYMNDRAPSVKMLLEYVALSL